MLIFGRVACLGGWVLQEKFGPYHHYVNQQKVRVDLFMDYINGATRPDAKTINSYADRDDLFMLFHQQETLEWLKFKNRNPIYLVMDSFAELTDQKFTHKDGWSFAAHYSDINLDKTSGNVVCDNLISPHHIHYKYDVFFNWVRTNLPNTKIIFIHFPVTFEDREMYLNQEKAITSALNVLAPKYNILNLHADPEFIEQKDSDRYHFTDKTVKHLASKII